MKITEVRTHVLATPLAFSMGWVTKRSTMVGEVTTDVRVSGD